MMKMMASEKNDWSGKMAPKLKQSFFSISKKDLLLTRLFNIANMHRQSQINFINLRIAIFQQNNTLLPSDARHWKFVFWNYFKALKKVQFKNINCPSSVSNINFFFSFSKFFYSNSSFIHEKCICMDNDMQCSNYS